MTESHEPDCLLCGSVWLATVDSVTLNRRKRTMADFCDDYGLMGFNTISCRFLGKLHDKLVTPC